MNFGKIEFWQLAFLVSTLAACTARSAESGSSDGGANSPTAAAGDAGRTSDGAAATASSGSKTPAELVATSWTWVTSSGAQRLAFPADGAYTSDVFLDAHPGESCGVEYATHREGAAIFSGAALTLEPTISTRTKTDSCSQTTLGQDLIAPDTTTYGWRLERSDGVDALVLTADDGTEVRYERD